MNEAIECYAEMYKKSRRFELSEIFDRAYEIDDYNIIEIQYNDQIIGINMDRVKYFTIAQDKIEFVLDGEAIIVTPHGIQIVSH
jgi:hypothetical protein